MKTKLLLLVMLLCTEVIFSQLVVEAPALEIQAELSYIETIKQSGESVKQTKELKKSYDILQDAADALEKVSDKLFDLNATRNIIQSQALIITRANRSYQAVKNIKGLDVEGINAATNLISTVVLAVQSLTRLTHELLTSGMFSMSDSERMQFLNEIEEKLSEEHRKLDFIERKIRYINTVTKYEEMFKN